ncbi:hypothetical protein [Actinoplanes sp. NPDC051851]|uniref:hypothetical protein n=1 Tax=Actinoplanes sp. NPDC051851 TaxID=3154753 RepID=UPI00344515FB
MQPTIGRIVHYLSHGSPVRTDGTQVFKSEPRAAIITAVTETPLFPNNPIVDLCVLNPTGLNFVQNVAYDDTSNPAGGTWHWLPRA